MSLSGSEAQTVRRSVLSVAGLNSFYGRAQVLFDVAINPVDSAVTALLGRNGAGKSTLLKSIAGAAGIRKTGSIMYDGREVLGTGAHRLAQSGIVLIPEDRRIFANLTVRGNLKIGRIAAGHGDRKSGDVDEVVALMPNLIPLLERGGQQLSGGEQQMVAIGRALMGSPRLLLMDEPSTGLAPVVLDDLRAGIRRMAEALSMTIVLSEQNSAFALSLCSHVIVIGRGRIVFTGSKEEFVADPELRTKYLSV